LPVDGETPVATDAAGVAFCRSSTLAGLSPRTRPIGGKERWVSETPNWDPTGEAANALLVATSHSGVGALSSAPTLSGLLARLLPHHPPEFDVMVSAAEVDVVRMITSHVQEGLDLETSIHLAASSLGALRPIDPEACMWVTTHFAAAVGYDVGGAEADEQAQPAAEVFSEPLVATNGSRAEEPPVAGLDPPQESSGASHPAWIGLVAEEKKATERAHRAFRRSADANRSGQAAAPAPHLPAALAARQGGPSPTAIAAGLVAVVLVYLVIAVAAKLPPFNSSASIGTSSGIIPPHPVTTTTVRHRATTTTKPHRTTTTKPPPPSTTPDSGHAPAPTLAQLIPDQSSTHPSSGIEPSHCIKVSPLPPGTTGVVGALACETIPGYKGWELFGYQLADNTDYSRSIAAYDADRSFDAATATDKCPPPALGQGLTKWRSASYAPRTGQVLQCLFLTRSGSSSVYPAYIWTLPSENAFFEMVAAASASATDLGRWWDAHGEPGS
jgi:hypothetical protein